MGNETTPREKLIAQVGVMRALVLIRGTPEPGLEEMDAAWKQAEAYVSEFEAEPDKPRECPCCTKLVTLCTKHYQLHEPGKKCSGCREDE